MVSMHKSIFEDYVVIQQSNYDLLTSLVKNCTHLNQRCSGVLLLLWGLQITVESHWKDPANDLTFIVFMPM